MKLLALTSNLAANVKTITRRAVVAAALAFGAAAPAHAGIPVIDIANLVNALQQLLSWYEQYEQMTTQINHARNQFEQARSTVSRLSGARSLGSLLRDPAIRGVLPAEFRDSSLIGAGRLSMGDVRRAAGVLGDYGVRASGEAEIAAGDRILRMRSIVESAQARERQIEGIADRLDGSEDQKASTDLVARAVTAGNLATVDLMATMASIEANRSAEALAAKAQAEASLAIRRSRGSASRARTLAALSAD